MAQKKNAPKAEKKVKPVTEAKRKPGRKPQLAAADVKKQPTAVTASPAPKNPPAAPKAQPAQVKTAPPAPKAQPVKAVAQAAATTTRQINERTTEMQNEATRIANENAQAVFGDLNERAKNSVERSTRIIEEMTDLARGNVEALVASSKVAARGVETLSQEAAEFGRKSFEEASAAIRTFAEVRSATDFFRLQSEFAKTQFDAVVAESSKISEAVLKLAGEVAEPITSRYSVAAERVKNIAA
jgi:phasin family protein